MKTCVFFGHRNTSYQEYKPKLKKILEDLIKNEGFTQFYSGGRGAFDRLCAEVVGEITKSYPHIKNTLVLSYLPPSNADFTLPTIYTDSMYLLEHNVPPRYSILETNKRMVDIADCVIVGIRYDWGGARRVYEYARKRKKRIINLCNEIE
ncbi:MAG: DUF1273 domain-containing protein [Clostridia bacterium]|nr:DUF1273 domain-containing protein [Clostridia bacterium]